MASSRHNQRTPSSTSGAQAAAIMIHRATLTLSKRVVRYNPVVLPRTWLIPTLRGDYMKWDWPPSEEWSGRAFWSAFGRRRLWRQ